MGTRPGHINGSRYFGFGLLHRPAFIKCFPDSCFPLPFGPGMELLLCGRLDLIGRPAFTGGARPHPGCQRSPGWAGLRYRKFGERIGVCRHQLHRYLTGRGRLITDPARNGADLDPQKKSASECLTENIFHELHKC